MYESQAESSVKSMIILYKIVLLISFTSHQMAGNASHLPGTYVLQWLLDQPFHIRGMLTEFGDTRHEPPLLFKIQVDLAVKYIHVSISLLLPSSFIISCYFFRMGYHAIVPVTN
jgi:hypothetical protein